MPKRKHKSNKLVEKVMQQRQILDALKDAVGCRRRFLLRQLRRLQDEVDAELKKGAKAP
jgi:hypothetical protein